MMISNIPPEVYAAALAYERGDLEDLPELSQATIEYAAFSLENGWGSDNTARLYRAIADYLLRQGHFAKGGKYETCQECIIILGNR